MSSRSQACSPVSRDHATAASGASLVLALLGVVAAVSGCSSVGDGYKPGELGNGGFYFSCDSAVSCDRYENDASKFPSAVALGSTFSVRFVPAKETKGTFIELDDSKERGVTVAPVGQQHVSKGMQSLVAIKSGFATLVSRDAAGQIIDYTVLEVARPDTLVVYRADDLTETPTPIYDVALPRPGERRSFRAFAQHNKAVLGGTLQVEWRSSDPAIMDVESATDGLATVVARSAGAAKLIATGGTFVQEIPVQVAP